MINLWSSVFLAVLLCTGVAHAGECIPVEQVRVRLKASSAKISRARKRIAELKAQLKHARSSCSITVARRVGKCRADLQSCRVQSRALASKKCPSCLGWAVGSGAVGAVVGIIGAGATCFALVAK